MVDIELAQSKTAAKPRVFYGWWMVGIAALVQFLGYGTSFWSFGTLVPPLESDFGWTRAELSFAMSISFLVGGLAGPLIGRLADAYGIGRVIVAGSLLMGTGDPRSLLELKNDGLSACPATWRRFRLSDRLSAGRH